VIRDRPPGRRRCADGADVAKIEDFCRRTLFFDLFFRILHFETKQDTA